MTALEISEPSSSASRTVDSSWTRKDKRWIVCCSTYASCCIVGAGVLALCFIWILKRGAEIHEKHDFLLSPGAELPIQVDVEGLDLTINDTAVITYYDRKAGVAYTCGHCLPESSHAQCIESKTTSGFDVEGDGAELAVLKVKAQCLDTFSDQIGGLQLRQSTFVPTRGDAAVLHHRGKTLHANILAFVDSPLAKGWVQVDTDWEVDHQITRLDPPFVVLLGETRCSDAAHTMSSNSTGKHCMGSRGGDSGSPWAELRDDHWELVGPHIGRAVARRQRPDGIELGEVAYAKIWEHPPDVVHGLGHTEAETSRRA